MGVKASSLKRLQRWVVGGSVLVAIVAGAGVVAIYREPLPPSNL
jgi:hypothetical protein